LVFGNPEIINFLTSSKLVIELGSIESGSLKVSLVSAFSLTTTTNNSLPFFPSNLYEPFAEGKIYSVSGFRSVTSLAS